MLPGPDMYKHCSSCHQLIIEETLMSGNTFGAIYWSDGKREAPMLPKTPWANIVTGKQIGRAHV